MTGPEVWLDMSRYPDTDPDAALTGEEQDLLSASLAVDDGELPDAVWEHMLAVVTGDTGDGTDDDGAEEAADAADDGGSGGWDGETVLDAHTDPGDDAATDPAVDPVDGDGWDGGAV